MAGPIGDLNLNMYQGAFPTGFRTGQTIKTPTGKKFVWSDFGKSLNAGAANLGDLFRNPGGMSPNTSAALAPIFSQQSNQVARQTAGSMAEARGAQSRSGVASGGWAQALQAAIQNAGNRNLANSRGAAIAQSEELRRNDLATLIQHMQFMTNTGLQVSNLENGQRATSASISQASNQSKQQDRAATMAAIASIVAAFA